MKDLQNLEGASEGVFEELFVQLLLVRGQRSQHVAVLLRFDFVY